jgi:transcriptional regulator with XRE-family HTH domain
MAVIDTVDERRRELGDFLRASRERLPPDALGLAATGRRRTPGLRREEVAQDAGVGLTWYTWLEQGRSINASPQVLAALARTLRLDRFERAHLFRLAAIADPDEPPESECVPASVRATLAQLEPYPAHVVTARFDLLAWNRAYAALMGDVEVLPRDRRNVLELLFLQPAWQDLALDWRRDAAHLVAQFRAVMASHAREPAWLDLLERLERGSEYFRTLWARHEVAGPTTKRKRFLHPTAGRLELESTSYWLADQPGVRMLVAVPVDEASHLAIERLMDAPSWNPWAEVATALGA